MCIALYAWIVGCFSSDDVMPTFNPLFSAEDRDCRPRSVHVSEHAFIAERGEVRDDARGIDRFWPEGSTATGGPRREHDTQHHLCYQRTESIGHLQIVHQRPQFLPAARLSEWLPEKCHIL